MQNKRAVKRGKSVSAAHRTKSINAWKRSFHEAPYAVCTAMERTGCAAKYECSGERALSLASPSRTASASSCWRMNGGVQLPGAGAA